MTPRACVVTSGVRGSAPCESGDSMNGRRTIQVAALAALALGCSRPAATRTMKVAAAADLTFAFKDAGAAFQKASGTEVTFTFGSTGNLAKQIEDGAPYDLFASANTAFADEVVREGVCDGSTKAPYGRGRIVVWTKSDAKVAPPKTLAELADPRFAKIAIANPEHAPYGMAAQEALESAGVWAAVKPKLVYGENIQQTLEFGESGNVDAAIVALSLATVTKGGATLTIDEAAHKPIDQVLVVCGRGGNAEGAKAFAAFLAGRDGRAIMRRYGFALPGEGAH
jgi:molybdate transport system substrate-binding protein